MDHVKIVTHLQFKAKRQKNHNSSYMWQPTQRRRWTRLQTYSRSTDLQYPLKRINSFTADTKQIRMEIVKWSLENKCYLIVNISGGHTNN
jgi:hypothetical protein